MEKTKEQVRDEFLRHVMTLAHYWADTKRDVREACEGTAFSILAMLDGESASMPKFIVAPAPHPDDKEYLDSHGNDYYPDNVDSNVRCDISGGLHDRFAQMS